MWNRGQVLIPEGQTAFAGEQSGRGNADLLTSDPLSSHFNADGVGTSPREITKYMIAIQKKKYDKITEIKSYILTRHCKLLQRKYTHHQIVRGVKLASQLSEYPFSFKFVEEMIQEHICLGDS